MDTLSNLRTFITVARTGSLSAAARELGVAASVVSKRIGQLEWRLQAPVLERSTRRVRLTPLGEQQLPQAQRLVAELDELLDRARQPAQALQGDLRVKVPTTLAVLHLGPLLHAFQREHPGVRLEVMALDRAVNPAEEGFDAAITLMPHSYPGVHDLPLAPMRRRVCAAPEYLARRGMPRHPSDLAGHDLLNFQPTGNTWVFGSATGPIQVTVQPRLSSNEAQLLLSAALEGNGIALLSEYVAAPALAAGQLQVLLADYPLPEAWIKVQVPQARWPVARVQALVGWLQGGPPCCSA